MKTNPPRYQSKPTNGMGYIQLRSIRTSFTAKITGGSNVGEWKMETGWGCQWMAGVLSFTTSQSHEPEIDEPSSWTKKPRDV